MLDQLIVTHCSPTLAGIKTANMFTCDYEEKQDVLLALRRLNKTLTSKGINIIPLRFCQKRVLLYVYRLSHLKRDFCNQSVLKILNDCGYRCHHPQRCLVQLIQKMTKLQDFPHEVGIFLGYPPEDVQGFIEKRTDCKCVGCWKVYGDASKAQALFHKYKQCTKNYCNRWQGGTAVEQLAVATA